MVRFPMACLLGALVLPPREAGAADQVRVAVQFHAPPGCSDRETFALGLRNRSTRIQIVDVEEHALLVSVRLAPGERLVHGELRLTDERKETELRAVDGADCAEVVEALSLTAALAIERTVAWEAEDSSKRAPVTARSPERGSAGPQPIVPEFEATPKAEVRWPSAAELDPHVAQLLVAAAASERIASQTSIGLTLGLLTRLRIASGFAPQLGFAGIYVPAEFVQPHYRLRVSYVGANIQACPVVATPVSGLSLAPCALFEVGVLRLNDRNVEVASPSNRPLWSLGGVGRASLDVTRHVALDFELALLWTTPSRRYISEVPAVQVGRAAPVVWQVAIGWLFGW